MEFTSTREQKTASMVRSLDAVDCSFVRRLTPRTVARSLWEAEDVSVADDEAVGEEGVDDQRREVGDGRRAHGQ